MNKEYAVSLEPTIVAIKNLKSALSVTTVDNQNTNLLLAHEGTNPERSRKILDELIVLLDKNIVFNKQKLFNNTVSYLDKRIAVFSKEKDSIESVKERYLQNNDILVLDKYIIDKMDVQMKITV
ncbi:hypothetical protein [Flavobacterium sp. GSA192]|uniref:hypothetical protein n=1 Tax=Flavobacterium sp. GSA192 TaxID=2576304 RepID=UPI00112B33A7|nr:hypothetical protein [Flavobacterium sp. GSA192]